MARRRSWSQTTHLPNSNNYVASLLLVNLLLIVPFSSAAVDISTINSISGDETLLSPGGKFELGFFRPGNSSKYYIGMWYKGLATPTVVWVANRDSPISDKYSSELKIINGNLVLLNESKKVTWSTNVNESSSTSPNSVVAVLLDDGNLVLVDGSDPTDLPIWQSFDFPTDTFLPGAKLGYTKFKKTRQFLTSWKNPNDPGTGLFSLELDRNEKQYILRWKRSVLYWSSGSWNGEIFSSVPEMRRNYLYNFSYFSNENESYFTYSLDNPSILARLVMDVSGQVKQFTWLDASSEWNLFWAQPRVTCDVYAVCGAFSTCNQFSVPYCQCLTGFKPMSDYDSGDFSGGCVRRTSLQCGHTRGVSMDKQGFLRSSQLKLPQSSQRVPIRTAEECESICFNNCSCIAYAYSIDMCDIWNDELLNLQHSEVDGSYNTINIKLASSDLQAEKINGKSNGKSNRKSNKRLLGMIIFSVVSLVVLLSCSIAYVSYRRVTRRRGSQENSVQESIDPGRLRENDQESIDVPFFDFKLILAATDNFSDSNELGEGGFGPVYKAKLPGGQVVAVKRLSSHSGQGLEEFKNEAVLIAKLQHRNLVRILGYCTEGDEKIVLYEYMPNKSLDTFIFDLTRRKLLDWSKRFEIIQGVARGLLYLHQDSRLRVIHRDMKTSNILLDEEMIPKISDFGLARIVGGRETEARTKRVIGTYGYMSPEYAIHGHFSIKSDVFSFGVVMLEIISGKKNTRFYHSDQALSLLGYAWNLWKEEKPLDLMDDTLVESCDSSEVLKCIVVGLLCVQDDPGDRPTMNNVVSVLSSESSDTTTLPNPKQPAFVARKDLPTSSSSKKSETQTDNELTVSLHEGR